MFGCSDNYRLAHAAPIMLSPNPDLHPIRQELLRWASAGHSSDVETAVPRHGPKNRGSWDPHLGQTARAGRPEAGPKVTPPTMQAKNRSLYMFGDCYPL